MRERLVKPSCVQQGRIDVQEPGVGALIEPLCDRQSDRRDLNAPVE
jgi:hypothetical protein